MTSPPSPTVTLPKIYRAHPILEGPVLYLGQFTVGLTHRLHTYHTSSRALISTSTTLVVWRGPGSSISSMKETLYMFTRKSQIHQIQYRRSEAVPEPLIAPLITDFADCTLSGNRKRARAIDWAVIQVTLVQYVIPYLRKGSVSHTCTVVSRHTCKCSEDQDPLRR